jgi:membrane peptidoglycan carboxypeptidase
VEPRVVRALYRDGRRLVVTPKVLRRTVTADTAAAMTGIMEQVVERGTGTPAQIPGYTIAGKTGTANKLINGRYSNETFASFVGFLPSNDPKLTILVVLDSPKGINRFGGPASAPIFKRIAEEALRYLSVPPSINPATPVLVSNSTASDALPTSLAQASGPLPMEPDEPGTVPDVRGLSARDAMRKLTKFGLTARMQGTGFVATQDPPAGTPADEVRVCRLTLERALVRQTAAAKLP